MKKCNCPYRQTIKVKVKKKEGKQAQSESKETFDIREKRIGIVFKILYVVAAFFAAVFKLMADGMRKGLEGNHILYACLAAFLLCLLIKMIVYIFHELKCFKISNSVSKKQIQKTNRSYSASIDYFYYGGIVAVIASISLEYYKHIVTQEFAAYMMAFGVAATVLAPIGECSENNRCRKICAAVKSLGGFFAILALFLLSGILIQEIA